MMVTERRRRRSTFSRDGQGSLLGGGDGLKIIASW